MSALFCSAFWSQCFLFNSIKSRRQLGRSAARAPWVVSREIDFSDPVLRESAHASFTPTLAHPAWKLFPASLFLALSFLRLLICKYFFVGISCYVAGENNSGENKTSELEATGVGDTLGARQQEMKGKGCGWGDVQSKRGLRIAYAQLLPE